MFASYRGSWEYENHEKNARMDLALKKTDVELKQRSLQREIRGTHFITFILLYPFV